MGGAETWLVALQKYWREHLGPKMDFLMCGGTSSLFDDEVRLSGARTYYVPFQRSKLGTFIKEFRRILDQEQYDAIHDHQGYASGWHFLLGAGRLPRVCVTHIHNPWIDIESFYGVTLSRRIAARIGKSLVHRLSTHVCGTSAEVLERYGFELRQVGSPSVWVTHCGFDVSRFDTPRPGNRETVLREFSWAGSSKIVLFVGRLDEALQYHHPRNHKNSWLALNVVRKALDRLPSVRFLMAGAGGPQRTKLENEVKQWGLEDKIRLIGIRRDIERLMGAADALLFPSRQEGLGMVAVEAQAAGLPVLASTAVPSECIVIPELYKALPLEESLDIWAETLIATMNKPRLPLEQCHRALRSSAFSIENSARRLMEIYSSAARGNPSWVSSRPELF